MYDVYIMKRTQIYLPEELHNQLQYQAKLQNISTSALIRNRLHQSMIENQQLKKRSAYEFLDNFIKQGQEYGKKLPKDIVSKHTEYYLETVVKSKK